MSSVSFQKTAVFDLDGTLVDSALDLLPSLNRVTATRGLPPISYDQIHQVVGQGGRAMIQRAFELNESTIEADELDSLLPIFFVDYEENICKHTRFYDGCLPALDLMASDGWTLTVCSNKHERLAKRLLKSLGELERFSAVTGGDTFDVKKPDPRHILKTIEMAGGSPSQSVVVGDSKSDIHAAQAANIPVIAVDFGYTDVPVGELHPQTIISHFDELRDAVAKIKKTAVC